MPVFESAWKKEKDIVSKEIEKLRVSIQTLCKSALPLGKTMDYLQEDVDAMQHELQLWHSENKQHAEALQEEQRSAGRGPQGAGPGLRPLSGGGGGPRFALHSASLEGNPLLLHSSPRAHFFVAVGEDLEFMFTHTTDSDIKKYWELCSLATIFFMCFIKIPKAL